MCIFMKYAFFFLVYKYYILLACHLVKLYMAVVLLLFINIFSHFWTCKIFLIHACIFSSVCVLLRFHTIYQDYMKKTYLYTCFYKHLNIYTQTHTHTQNVPFHFHWNKINSANAYSILYLFFFKGQGSSISLHMGVTC